jgi:hypothetical protein
MSRISLGNIGEAVGRTYFKKGLVTGGNYAADELTVEIGGEVFESVPVFYRCGSEAELLANGSLKGAASAFAEGDSVTVCFINSKPIVTGFTDKLRPCGRYRLVYPAEGGYYVGTLQAPEPSQFVTETEFSAKYVIQEPSAVNPYSLKRFETGIDECVTRRDFSLRYGYVTLESATDYYDECRDDRWGDWLELRAGGGEGSMGLCFYESVTQVIFDDSKWDTYTTAKLDCNGGSIDLSSSLHRWLNYPYDGTDEGLRIISVNGIYGGAANGSDFIAASCVMGTGEIPERLNVYVYSADGLSEAVFQCSAQADYGIGFGQPEMMLAMVK